MPLKAARLFATAAVLTFVSACQQQPAKAPVASSDLLEETAAPAVENDSGPETAAPRHRFSSWQGEWLGPEGMFVIIMPVEPGMYQLQMQSDLETLGTYIGQDDEHGIRFTRNGEQLMLRRATGPETGMKWLEQSRTCLMVREGEGYCRD